MALVTGITRRARVLALAGATLALFAAALPVHAGFAFNDVSISQSDSPDPVVSGATLTYTLTVTLVGGNPAGQFLTVTDTLPAGVTYVSATPTAGTCGEAALVVTCNFPAPAVGASETVTIVVVAGAPGSISNTASVVANVPESVPANNTATEVTTVVAATPSPSPSPTPTLSPAPTATPVAAVLPDTAQFGTDETAAGAALGAAVAVASLMALLFGLTRRRARSG